MASNKINRLYEHEDFRENTLEFLWEQFSEDSYGDIPAHDLARLREAFMSGFIAANGLYANFIPRLDDMMATSFLTKLNAEIKVRIEEIRKNRKIRKGIT